MEGPWYRKASVEEIVVSHQSFPLRGLRMENLLQVHRNQSQDYTFWGVETPVGERLPAHCQEQENRNKGPAKIAHFSESIT